jgi:AcrR family transcriptional regulator
MTETRDKILDTAERLFGEYGYAATSLRQIIAAAGVNLAAIHYHFGSKEELLDDLVKRKVAPLNAERMALLDRCEAEAGDRPVPLDKLLNAFLQPPLQRVKENPEFARLMGRLYGEGLMPQIAERNFHAIVARFTAAFCCSLPGLTDLEVTLRLQFMVGAMAHTMMSASVNLNLDGDLVVRELLAFLAGGMQAPRPALVEAMK